MQCLLSFSGREAGQRWALPASKRRLSADSCLCSWSMDSVHSGSSCACTSEGDTLLCSAPAQSLLWFCCLFPSNGNPVAMLCREGAAAPGTHVGRTCLSGPRCFPGTVVPCLPLHLPFLQPVGSGNAARPLSGLSAAVHMCLISGQDCELLRC